MVGDDHLVDQLSGARAPRDKGQRLGSADPAPWMQHPEMASLNNVRQCVAVLVVKFNVLETAWRMSGQARPAQPCLASLFPGKALSLDSLPHDT
eukprot:1149543-Pelagomonas_calceolata.AAC.7